jgi:hypothetical protein
MAQTIEKHDPAARDVEGDDYDPAFDADKTGTHDQTENDNRGKAAKDHAESGGMGDRIPSAPADASQ